MTDEPNETQAPGVSASPIETTAQITMLLEQEVKAVADPNVSVLLIELDPGDAGSPPHLHPGPVFGYVLEGKLRFQCEGHPEHIYEAGDAFWEPGRPVVHLLSANASETERTRFLALCIGAPGEPFITPVDPRS